MKVNISLSPEHTEPYAVIYTDKVTEEILRIMDLFSTKESPITAQGGEDDLVVLKPQDIYLVHIEEGETILYGAKKKYRSKKRLYEISRQLGPGFMQISRSALVNLSYMDAIEPGFSGSLLLKLKNGMKEYVSRSYLPAFKQYLGL
ncbi:MAG: LytTR family transcriptional regulator [Aeriscardovia sp.]|nr:LytTR family transcriptional regulator [Aeriscardovia sp.]